MGEDLYFSSIVTKSLETINSEDRFFEGYLTVEVKDKQGEITIVDELYKVLPVWMDRGAPISDTHSNRIIGKGINFARATYKSGDEEIPAIKITGKIHKNYELDNEIWSKIKSGEYKGLSFGGATKANRTPKVMKDGSVAYQLTDLEHYEVAVCKDPAVPLALITDFNPVAKAMADHTEDRDGKMVIKCSKFGCRIDLNKAEKKAVKLTEDGRKILQEATTVADLYKVDLSGIETFEGKVEALMDEGKSRQSAENIVGSFTKKTAEPKDKPYKFDEFVNRHEKTVKKDAPTGHDPTQVAHSPDTPREMELEKGKDHSNTGGDTSGMYNQNGAEQRVNSGKAAPLPEEDPDKVEGEDNLKNYLDSLDEESRKKFLSFDEIQSIMSGDSKKGAVGGEVPPQWTGSGSPYPEGERKVIKRKKIIKESSWKDLKNKAFELDMQWRVIDLVKDSMDGKGDNKPKQGDAPQSHADQSKDIKNLDYELDGSSEEGETIGIGRDWDGTAGGLFYKQPKQGKAPIIGKKKALIDIAKKLKKDTIQGKLLAGSDPEVSTKLLEHGKQIEEHHKPLKQRTIEHHVKPSGNSPQVGLKQLEEQERSATNNPEDSHFGGGMGSRGQEQDYESGYGMMGGMHEEQKKPVGSEEQFHRSRASEKIPKQGKRESDSDYKQRQEAYVHEKINPQNKKRALINLSSLFKNNRSKFKDPDYPLRLDNDNRKELAAAGATHAGGKATRMTARQLDTSEAAIRGHKNRSRSKRKKEMNASEEDLDKKLGYAKKEGFTYERDHDPKNHVGRETKDHARTGSAQQAQYNGTEGKSESKEEPLKELTDGELEEVEKLGKAKKKVMELSKMRSDKWDKDEKDEFNRYTGEDRGYHGDDERGDEEEETEQEVEPQHEESDKKMWEAQGRDMQDNSRELARDKRLTDEQRSHATELDEKVGQELGEVPRSKVQGTDSKTGKKLVSPHGKHMAKRIIRDETENVLDDSDAKDLRDRAVNAAHALTITEDNANRWKSSLKALSKKLIEELKEGTNAANGTSPRGGDFSGTADDGKFNVRHNGGRKTNRHGRRAEDLGNFP